MEMKGWVPASMKQGNEACSGEVCKHLQTIKLSVLNLKMDLDQSQCNVAIAAYVNLPPLVQVLEAAEYPVTVADECLSQSETLCQYYNSLTTEKKTVLISTTNLLMFPIDLVVQSGFFPPQTLWPVPHAC
jgi:hypothetical protein